MIRKIALCFAILFLTSCSRLATLTPELLSQAEARWNSSRPGFYRLVIEMKGDRVEEAQYAVTVRDGEVIRLLRNGEPVLSRSGDDYSMDGLFKMLRQELSLAERPALLGAPGGYSAYFMANFDERTGRLLAYRRTVGGTTNTIDIKVLEFETQE